MTMHTTLSKIREQSPCEDGYIKLCKNLGGVRKYGAETPLKFSRIIESNGVEDAIWCLRTICPKHEKEVRLFAADVAESVLHLYEEKYPGEDGPRKATQAARDFAEGRITIEDLCTAYAAAAAAAGALALAGAGAGAADAAVLAAAYAAAADAAVDAAVLAALDAAYAADADAAVDAAVLAAVDAAVLAADAGAAAGALAAERNTQSEMLIERFG